MGSCHGGGGGSGGCLAGGFKGGLCGGCGQEDPIMAVSLKHAPRARERWARKVGRFSPLVRELLFADGKVLADYASFLRDSEPGLMTSLWQLSMARFATRWSTREQGACTKLARGLCSSWVAYLESPQGFGTFEDLSKWNNLAALIAEQEEDVSFAGRAHSQTLEQAPEVPVGNLINEEHSRYIFAISAMIGIHVATVCHRICQNATTFALGPAPFAEQFDRTFPRLSYVECLQNSCYTYRIPAEGSAYSPSTATLTNEQLDVPYFLDDFCPELFAQVRRLCGVTDQQYFGSICRPDVELVEFLSTSASGEFFFFSHDGRFMLKTAKRFEAEALIGMLPDMIERFERGPESLLGRYLGLYRVYGDEVDYDVLFFVMQSATQHKLPIHHTYDLKGCSGRHRRAKPGQSVGKDLDWFDDFGDMQLSSEDADALLLAYADDLAVLRKHGITDYSILLQVHDRQATRGQTTAQLARSTSSSMESATTRLRAMPMSESSWSSQMARADLAEPRALLPGHASCSSPSRSPSWLPSQGISSSNKRYLYTMALIDLLIPWTWRAKVEVGYYEIVSCGHGYRYSKLHPAAYADRQLAMLERMCGRGSEEDSGDEDGQASESDGD